MYNLFHLVLQIIFFHVILNKLQGEDDMFTCSLLAGSPLFWLCEQVSEGSRARNEGLNYPLGSPFQLVTRGFATQCETQTEEAVHRLPLLKWRATSQKYRIVIYCKNMCQEVQKNWEQLLNPLCHLWGDDETNLTFLASSCALSFFILCSSARSSAVSSSSSLRETINKLLYINKYWLQL